MLFFNIRTKRNSCKKGFTLPELMVAMAITSLIGFLFIEIVQTITKTIKISRTPADAVQQAQYFFERLKIDLNQMPRRSDIGCYMASGVADSDRDFFRVISQVRGNGGDRGVSLVGYKLCEAEDCSMSLHRGVHGYNWSDSIFMSLDELGQPRDLCSLPTGSDLEDRDYEVLVPGVFRVALAYQCKNSGFISNAPPLYSLGTNQPSRLSIQRTNIASVIVGIAMLDQKKLELLTPEQKKLLISRFTEVPEGVTPLSHWNTNIEYLIGALSEGLAKEVVQSVRVFQQFYPLN